AEDRELALFDRGRERVGHDRLEHVALDLVGEPLLDDRHGRLALAEPGDRGPLDVRLRDGGEGFFDVFRRHLDLEGGARGGFFFRCENGHRAGILLRSRRPQGRSGTRRVGGRGPDRTGSDRGGRSKRYAPSTSRRPHPKTACGTSPPAYAPQVWSTVRATAPRSSAASVRSTSPASSGSADHNRATAPATCGAAADVPESPPAYAPPRAHDRRDTPGATRSAFRRFEPSARTGPMLE